MTELRDMGIRTHLSRASTQATALIDILNEILDKIDFDAGRCGPSQPIGDLIEATDLRLARLILRETAANR